MTPRVGVTHHVVLHLDTVTRVGVIVTPGTYRVTKKPNLVPRLAVGDPRGLDYGTWWSFVQDDFSGGSGQYRWNKDSGNNRFAESLFMDIGVPGQRAGSIVGELGQRSVSDFQGGTPLRDAVSWAGALASAVTPTQTTAVQPMPVLMTSKYPAFMFMHSQRPLFLHNQFAAVYTNFPPDIFDGPIVIRGTRNELLNQPSRGQPTDFFKGRWAVIATNIANGAVLSAVMHSTFVIASIGSLGLMAYGSSNGINRATWHTPAYSTVADLLQTFDDRLWRTYRNKLAYLDPATGAWGAYQDVGEATWDVRATVVFAGKIMMGKADGLYAYDAGRIYSVQRWPHSIDPSNFAFMKVLRGDLYFNLGTAIYRLSSASTVEKLDWPLIAGTVIAGEVTDEELYVIFSDTFSDSRIFIFNPETGGVREWFRSADICNRSGPSPWGPSSIMAAGGALWMSPMYLSAGNNSSSAITAVTKLLPPQAQIVPNFHKGGRSLMITSELTMGYPDLDKYWDAVDLEYNLYSSADRIEVYYLPQIQSTQPIQSVQLYHQPGATYTDVTAAATDGIGSGNPNTVSVAAAISSDSGLNDTILIGFDRKVSGITLDVIGTAGAKYFTVIQPWEIQIGYNPTSIGDSTIGSPFDGVSITPRTLGDDGLPGHLGGLTQISWWPPPNWIPTLVQGVTAYWISISGTNLVGAAWTGRLYEITTQVFGPVGGLRRLEDQAWSLLGTVTNNQNNRIRLPFPNNIISKTMMLKFLTYGPGQTRPEIKQFKLKYMPVGPDANLLRISFAAQAINNIKLLNGSIENNAQGIAAAAFSMIGANIPYVVELPWPPPVGHTRRAKILLGEPGAQIPIMTFDNTLGVAAAPEASIPIIIEQV